MSSTSLSGAMRRNVSLLALSQAAVMTSISLVLASSVVIGVDLATPALATLPLAFQYLGTMLALYPLARLIVRFGHKPVFIGGALVGALGLSLAALAIQQRSFPLFTLSGGLVGVFSAVGQYYRFAAVEAVTSELRGKAISLTLSGGVLAAFVGPNLARSTRDMLGQPFAASFLALAVVALIAAVLANALRLRHRPATTEALSRPPFILLFRQPEFLLAVVSGVLGYTLMNLLMTATPLAMMCNRLGFAETATVIQWHVVAMFAPSFFTGSLIQRFGMLPVMFVGGISTMASIGVAINGESLQHFEWALVLLGIGWNFLYIGATARLVECCPAEQKAGVQAVNDSLVFLSIAIVTFSAGGLVDRYGWVMLNFYSAIPLSLLLAAIAWQWLSERRIPRPSRA